MPERLQPTQREMLILLNDRVSQLMKMTAEIVTENKIRNGRIEKVERSQELAIERSHDRHEALLDRIKSAESHLTNNEERLSQSEIEAIRASKRQDAADLSNKRRVRIESPWVFLVAAVALAGPIVSIVLKFWS